MKTRLKELRIEKGISQIDLAKGLGVAQSAIPRYEQGTEMRASVIIKACQFLGCSINYLLMIDDENVASEISETEKEELALVVAYRKLSNDDKKIIDSLLKRLQK